MKKLVCILLLINCSLYGQWTTANLSEPKSDIATFAHGDRVFFVGGEDSFAGNDKAEIYDFASDSWSTVEIPVSAYGWTVVDVGDFVAFVDGVGTGSSRMMIYDKSNDSWIDFNEINNRFGAGVGGGDNKLYFAGGSGNITDIDILDLETLTWTKEHLSVGRRDPSVAFTDDKVFFIGGSTNINISELSDLVDVYDIGSSTWSTFTLNEAKKDVGIEVIGNKLILAGGQISNNLSTGFSDIIEVVDIIDFTITTYSLSIMNAPFVSCQKDGKAIFFGIRNSSVEIFDTNTNSVTSYSKDANDAYESRIACLGDRVFITGVSDSDSEVINVLNIVTGQWEDYQLDGRLRAPGVIAHKWKAFVAGGTSDFDITDAIHVFTDESLMIVDNDSDGFFSDVDCDDTDPTIYPGAPELAGNGIDEDCDGEDWVLSSTDDQLNNEPIIIYPNPVSEILFINKEIDSAALLSSSGVKVSEIRNSNIMDVSSLPNGVYLFQYKTQYTSGTHKLIISNR